MVANALPGVSADRTAAFRNLLTSQQGVTFKPGGVVIAGASSRDPLNTGDLDVLRCGLAMGKITASGKYAPSIIGALTVLYVDGATTMTVSLATAIEINRRIGASGTFNLTGVTSAAGHVQTVTVTYSACSITTGVITCTALSGGANAVQDMAVVGTATAGSMKLGFYPSGDVDKSEEPMWTGDIAWNTTPATMVTSANTAIDALLGASLVVATDDSGSGANPKWHLTFSGAGWNNRPQPLVIVDVSELTGATSATIAHATAGAGSNDFQIGSYVQPEDGSETILGLNGHEGGVKVTDDDGANIDVPMGLLLLGGQIDASQIVNYPTDVSLRTWLKTALRAVGKGFTFDDDFA